MTDRARRPAGGDRPGGRGRGDSRAGARRDPRPRGPRRSAPDEVRGDAGASGDGPRRSDGDEPAIPEGITGGELPAEVRRELTGLPRSAAGAVARHLAAAGLVLDDDPELALAHAAAARQRAPRLAVVREACAVAAYQAGQYETALREFRAVRRITGSPRWLATMADCERGLGRPERALDLASSPDAAALDRAEAVELRIVAAGAHRDLGDVQRGLRMLRIPELEKREPSTWSARLRYAYADLLLAAGEAAEARSWFGRALEVDVEEETDAFDRLEQLAERSRGGPGRGSQEAGGDPTAEGQ